MMDIRQITPDYAVSPQISPEDLPAIVQAGFRTVVCNRPDAEVPPDLSAAAIRIATEAAGLTFVEIPVTHQTLNMEMVAAQRAAMAASDGPVLAYCASGNRSSVIWSLGQAGHMPTEDIIALTTRAGYDLRGLIPRIEALAHD
jgi:uncharacterized protein (TIGR01244 family)